MVVNKNGSHAFSVYLCGRGLLRESCQRTRQLGCCDQQS
jgi:hypothetical protein